MTTLTDGKRTQHRRKKPGKPRKRAQHSGDRKAQFVCNICPLYKRKEGTAVGQCTFQQIDEVLSYFAECSVPKKLARWKENQSTNNPNNGGESGQI